MSVPSQNGKAPSWQIHLAAEGIAAAQFARCGFDVSIQYGADKPAYDMVVTKADSLLKVSVKGSEDGVWNLTQSYIKRAADLSGRKADYHGAIDLWLDHHASRTICCLVQFQGVSMEQLPRLYLATPKEVAVRLRDTAEGRGDSVLYEGLDWVNDGLGPIERLPVAWRFSAQRIEELLIAQQTAPAIKPVQPSAAAARNWAAGMQQSHGAVALGA